MDKGKNREVDTSDEDKTPKHRRRRSWSDVVKVSWGETVMPNINDNKVTYTKRRF